MKSAFVALVGLPNAGKSTLLNRLVGEKLSITSAKPQTTRDRIIGIRTEGETQLVFFDTPGLLEPEHVLHERMRASALRALEDADVVVFVADATRGAPPPLDQLVDATTRRTAPVITALNKCDRLTAEQRAALESAVPGSVGISATQGDGIEALLQAISAHATPGAWPYPGDELSTQPVRFFAGELVREAALEQLEEEVPHGIACVIEEFREGQTPVYIRATLYVERESHKRIVIGAGGSRIRALGAAARERIEALVGAPVYLDLHVKVDPRWRREQSAVDRMGYRGSR